MPPPATESLFGPPVHRPPTFTSSHISTTPLRSPSAPAGVTYANPFTTGPRVVLKNAPEMAVFAYQGATVAKDRGPFSITKAVLTTRGKSEPVYLVALNGTNINWVKQGGQPNGMTTNVLAAANQGNRYLDGARAAMLNLIPKDATVILSGHSQGGMIAQQLAADPAIQARFNVRNTVTFGSPQVGANLQEGKVRRLVDFHDQVPNLSVESGNRGAIQRKADPNQVSRNGGSTNPVTAHTTSYFQPQAWGRLNALGETSKAGNASISFDQRDVTFVRMERGTDKFLLASVEPGSQGRGASLLGDAAIPGASVRLALAQTVRGALPEASFFNASARQEQGQIVTDLLGSRGLPNAPHVTEAVMAFAQTLPSQPAAARTEPPAAGAPVAGADRPAAETTRTDRIPSGPQPSGPVMTI